MRTCRSVYSKPLGCLVITRWQGTKILRRKGVIGTRVNIRAWTCLVGARNNQARGIQTGTWEREITHTKDSCLITRSCHSRPRHVSSTKAMIAVVLFRHPRSFLRNRFVVLELPRMEQPQQMRAHLWKPSPHFTNYSQYLAQTGSKEERI